MADASPALPAVAAPAPPVPQKPQKKKIEYEFRFEPVGDFTAADLFIKGEIAAKMWITPKISAVYKSLTGEEVDKINEAVKVKDGMSVTQFNTEITYYNLAYSVIEIDGKPVTGGLQDKLGRYRKMSANILTLFQVAYLEFNAHVNELLEGEEALGIAKKS